MSPIRFMKVAPYYQRYVKQLYDSHPSLEPASYEMQYNALMNGCFSWSDYWKTHLEATGDFEVQEIILDVAPLQKQWAKEHKVKYDEDNWVLDILESQIAEFKPHILFAHDLLYTTQEFHKRVRGQNPSIKLIIGWDGIAINDPKLFSECDLVLSCSEYVVDFYQNAGVQARLFSNGFEKSLLSEIDNNDPKYNTSFVGSVMLFKGGHNNRLQWLSSLAKEIDVDLWLSLISSDGFFTKNQWKWLTQGNFKDFITSVQLKKFNRGEVFGLEMYQILADSKITLNMHIDTAKKAGNLRLYEATGIGTCLVTDWKDNLKDYFEIDKEIVAYKSEAECIDKIKYLLNNDSEREAIAKAGHQRTLENYSLESCIKTFTDHLMSLL